MRAVWSARTVVYFSGRVRNTRRARRSRYGARERDEQARRTSPRPRLINRGPLAVFRFAGADARGDPAVSRAPKIKHNGAFLATTRAPSLFIEGSSCASRVISQS